MGRSVSYPSHAEIVAYRDWLGDEEWDEWQWDAFVDGIRDEVSHLWPSIQDADRWIGREDRVIAENNLVEIGVSEYCGLAAVWVAPKDTPLALGFINRIRPKFLRALGNLRKLGTFSNGEAVFERT